MSLRARPLDEERDCGPARLLDVGAHATVVADKVVPEGFLPKDLMVKTAWGFVLVKDDSQTKNSLEIKIDIPKKLSGKEKKLYDELVKEARLDIDPQNKGFFG